ncbi:Rieske 2Fe-2S domain-containing protein [Mycobacterium talmoniae]|uniref:Rieske domain-containing protein n=1 Tax=Mycobacterium talmoniae TaxID=1858794 RepID=A0A1S1NF12_9MYCO|nr:Rieske 2Fe-2S domain-containing protein [Mycobacterium talmoniae]OHV04255.1 hypothetical protein BKN37_10750 [Mycobacterium talmoniae]
MPASIPPRALTGRLEQAKALDVPAQAIAKKVRQLLAPQGLKEAVSGTRLGHPVHPPLTDLVIGTFTSATLLDLLAPRTGEQAARRLIALGIGAAIPTAVTGSNDWADTELSDATVRRVGLVHAGVNDVALLLYGASWVARWRGKRARGVLLALAGAAVLQAGGYLGGHLSFVRGVGVNQTVFDPGPAEWTAVATASELTDGQPQSVEAAGTPLLVVRNAGVIHAIHDRCSHRGCLLSEGELDGDVVTCSCHGSQFDVRDGAVLRGPAITGQPTFQTRENNGQVEVRIVSRG